MNCRSLKVYVDFVKDQFTKIWRSMNSFVNSVASQLIIQMRKRLATMK